MSESSVDIVIGLDGCPKGWLGAVWLGPGHQPESLLLASLSDAERCLPPETRTIAVDIPIGLLGSAVPGGRPCDRPARRLLGPRASSVFSPPAAAALAAGDYAEACLLNKQSGPEAGSLSKQSFAIFPKISDAAKAVAGSIWLRERVIEIHPEVCFRMMSGSPLQYAKKKTAGKDERRRLLRQAGFENLEAFEVSARALGAATDDALDACVAAWSAWRRALGTAEYLPADASGPDYHMRIWY